ncbi:MAG: hypothetical protein KDA85_03600 [Planctomycetaceae bacterium]|nr:hypothetical protein [Planctomycetaceae bacterium]
MSDELNPEFDDQAESGLTELVAYLDGELSESDTETIEHRLVADGALREEASRLDRAWQLLESIDDVSASHEFTARTLASMQATALEQTSSGAGLKTIRSQAQTAFSLPVFLFWALGGFAVTALGVRIAHQQAERRQSPEVSRILENLEFLEQLPSYRSVRTVESLQLLLEEPVKAAADSGAATPSADGPENASGVEGVR